MPNLFDLPIGKVPTVTLAGAVDLLAAVFPGEDRNKLGEQFRSAAKAGYIPFRWDGRNRTYGPEGVGTGALLIAAYGFGIRDAAISAEILRACNSWSTINPRPANVPKGVRPIVAANVLVTRGEYWAYKLCTFQSKKTGQRQIISEVYNVEGPQPDAESWLVPDALPLGTLTIGLWPLLEPLDAIYNGLRTEMAGFDA